uniref:AMOP domain-containing protein n=1 Tax=Romanomermis culicivorax TaxID=13658 RepID=A0A915JKP6_ROMCU
MVFLTDKMAQLSYVILNYHSLNFAGSDIMGNMKRGRCTIKCFILDRMTIYPDTVNMLGDTVVRINGPCFDKPGGDPPQLFIGENRPASCRIKNSAIAECRMDQFYQWGLKDLFLKYAGSKAYVGTIYYAPVGLDPYGIMIDDLPNLFQNPPPQKIVLRWYTGNFTDSKLRLILYAYEEMKDVKSRKFVNTMQKLVEIDIPLDFTPNVNKSHPRSHALTRSEIWDRLSLHNTFDITRYSFGVLKLTNDQKGIWSPPIPFHWLWSPKDLPEPNQPAIVSEIAARSCIHWFDDDGTQWNFVQHTEYNASCPCLLKQAYADFGRFMPHPRCSRKFRNVGCDVYVGAHDCFLSAQNIIRIPGNQGLASSKRLEHQLAAV